jgi:hypothetical protein
MVQPTMLKGEVILDQAGIDDQLLTYYQTVFDIMIQSS